MERLIGARQRLWINGNPIQPGNFDRLFVDKDINHITTSVSLRRISGEIVPMDLRTEIMTDHKIQKVTQENPVPYAEYAEFKKDSIQVPPDQTVAEQMQKNTENKGSNRFRLETKAQLIKQGLQGFTVTTAGRESYYPVEVVKTLIRDPEKRVIIVRWEGPEGEVFSDSYSIRHSEFTPVKISFQSAVIEATRIINEARDI